MPIDPAALAREILDAYAARQPIAIPPSARDGGLDLTSAYAVESEVVRLRLAEPLAVDPYERNRVTGAFVLADEASNDTVAAGMVL